MRKKWRSLWLILLACGCGWAEAQGGGGVSGRQASLAGLTSLRVSIDNAEGLANSSLGLRPADIADAVQGPLKAAGLQIVDDPKGLLTPPGFPTLHVVVRAEHLRTGASVYAVNFNLMQEVSLVRRPGLIVNASTWHSGTMGRAAQAGGVLEAVAKSSAEFVADYKAANPRR